MSGTKPTVTSVEELKVRIREEVGWDKTKQAKFLNFPEKDEDGKIQLRERLWITSRKEFKQLCNLLENNLGGVRSEDKGLQVWSIPKGRKVEVPNSSANSTKLRTNSSMEPQPTTKNNKEPFDLRFSANLFPELMKARPIIFDKDGVPIDGFHRELADPNWPKIVIPMKSTRRRRIARFILNCARRNVSDKEKREFLKACATEFGWSAKEMEKHLPFSYSWIMKYLPDEYKDKVKAEAGAKGGVASGVARQSASTHEAKDEFGRNKVFPCGIPNCMEGTYDPKRYDGIHLCSNHRDLFNKDLDAIEKLKVKKPLKQHACSNPHCLMSTINPVEKDGKLFCSEECATVKPIESKVKKKKHHPPPDWRERMHPKVSKMESDVINELKDEGWPIDTEYWIPLTKPDGYLHEISLSLEVDGTQVHKGRKAEFDDIVNKILLHRGIEIIRKRHSHFSVKRKEEIKTSFRECMIKGYRAKGLSLPVKVQKLMECDKT